MAEGGGTVLSVEALIDECRKSEKRRAFARKAISLLIVAVVLGHVWLICAIVTDFRDNRLDEFATAMEKEAVTLSPVVASKIGSMAERLYPHYVSTFQRKMESDWPILSTAAAQEMKLLDDYARQKWPEIEEGILDVLTSCSETVEDELTKLIPAEDAEMIAAAYADAVVEKYEHLFSSVLDEHVAAAKQIADNIQRLIPEEPDIVPPVSMQQALGLILELMGNELQKIEG